MLKNPGIQADEVLAVARMTTVAPEMLIQITERREWISRTEIAAAIVRNPKTPVPVAVKVLQYVSDRELRQMAKTTGLRGPILSAVRRKVAG